MVCYCFLLVSFHFFSSLLFLFAFFLLFIYLFFCLSSRSPFIGFNGEPSAICCARIAMGRCQAVGSQEIFGSTQPTTSTSCATYEREKEGGGEEGEGIEGKRRVTKLQAFILRARLVPYIYTQHALSYVSGIGLLRPMYYSYPEEDVCPYLSSTPPLSSPSSLPIPPLILIFI